MFEKAKELCDSFLPKGVPGFDLMVYKNGEEILRYMGGYSDIENKVPTNGKEIYHIYSCSKLITCVAALQLWEKGAFSLEDKLYDYMPEFTEMTVKTEDGIQNAKNPILIKHLFEMTAGFSYDLNSPHLAQFKQTSENRCPTRESMKYLAKEPLLFEPGEQWNYSLCHDVLAALVEVISGQGFEEYVQQNIFKPLGMTHSTFLPTKEQLQNLACQYQYDKETQKTINIGKETNKFRIGSAYASGGAGCISTVEDYMNFLDALRIGDKILKKETIALMTTDRLNEAQTATYYKAETYGYGLGVRTPKKGGKYTDYGWGGAAGAYYVIDPENDLTLYFAMHLLSSPVQGERAQVYDLILAELQGKKVEIKTFDKEYNLTY